MESTLLTAEGITKRYGKKTVLDNISFSLRKGEVLGLFGPNGSGKSTLLDILAMASRPSEGTLSVFGRDPLKESGILRTFIGYVPQDIALFEELTVTENLLCWTKEPMVRANLRISQILCELKLTEVAKVQITKLSGGMKRRVNLAAALLFEPKLLLLDEPFVGMDSESLLNTQTLLSSFTDSGTAAIISGHTPEHILPLAQKIMIIVKGVPAFFGERDIFLSHGNGDPKKAMCALLAESAQ
jgi:ABC-2 type transport system ATP-binding protein